MVGLERERSWGPECQTGGGQVEVVPYRQREREVRVGTSCACFLFSLFYELFFSFAWDIYIRGGTRVRPRLFLAEPGAKILSQTRHETWAQK